MTIFFIKNEMDDLIRCAFLPVIASFVASSVLSILEQQAAFPKHSVSKHPHTGHSFIPKLADTPSPRLSLSFSKRGRMWIRVIIPPSPITRARMLQKTTGRVTMTATSRTTMMKNCDDELMTSLTKATTQKQIENVKACGMFHVNVIWTVNNSKKRRSKPKVRSAPRRREKCRAQTQPSTH